MQNRHSATSTPAKTRLFLHKTTPRTHPPSLKVVSVTPPIQSSTARLLRRLKGSQHGRPPEPSEFGVLTSRIDITVTETDLPPRAAIAPTPGPSSSTLTTTNNIFGLGVGGTPFAVSTQQTHWMTLTRTGSRYRQICPLLTGTPSGPSLSSHKPSSRLTPASVRQPVLHHVPITLPFSDPWPICVYPSRTEMTHGIKPKEDEQPAYRFRNTRVLQRYFDLWK